MSNTKLNGYTNKEGRNQFMRWLITNYGYDRVCITDNSRVLSEKYEKENHVKIPKNTIYRWLKEFEHFVADEYQTEASNYIEEGIMKIA